MHLLEHLHRNVKTVAMPTAMVVGALLCRPISALEELSGQMITPTLIFLMLFVTFCRVKPSQMKPSMLHVWLLLVQTVACIGVFLLLHPLDLILAQGAMVCVLAPVAMTTPALPPRPSTHTIPPPPPTTPTGRSRRTTPMPATV